MSEYADNSTKLCLYTHYAEESDGTRIVLGYAYGEPWVSQALLMGDISFDTPEEAKEWWEKSYGNVL